MIRLVSVNIERSKHLDRVFDFFEKEQPDVICLQEVCKIDLPKFAKYFGGNEPLFSAVTNEKEREGRTVVHGTAIGSALACTRRKLLHYSGEEGVIPDTDESNYSTSPLGLREIAVCDFVKNGETFRVASTHFTWSERGAATDQQRADMKNMLAVLQDEKDFVLTGDFNAPRGGEIFAMLADCYKDNIPSHYKTSIDLDLHRAASEGRTHEIADKMVDGLFSTPGYRVENVKLQFGVSDHAAIVASVWKA